MLLVSGEIMPMMALELHKHVPWAHQATRCFLELPVDQGAFQRPCLASAPPSPCLLTSRARLAPHLLAFGCGWGERRPPSGAADQGAFERLEVVLAEGVRAGVCEAAAAALGVNAQRQLSWSPGRHPSREKAFRGLSTHRPGQSGEGDSLGKRESKTFGWLRDNPQSPGPKGVSISQ